MKERILCIICVVLTLSTGALAEDGLSANEINIVAGKTATLEIALNNTERAYNSFVFDLRLPEGISVSKGETYDATYNPARANGSQYNLEVGNPAEGVYRFVGYHNTNANITGTNGTIIRITLLAAESAAGSEGQGCILSNPASAKGGTSVLGFTDAAGFQSYGFADAEFVIYVYDDETDINNICSEGEDNGPVYRLNGQRVERVGKGVYIKKGKKILNK